MSNRVKFFAFVLSFFFVTSAWGEEKSIFSGPQIGEKLTSLKADGIFDKHAGKEFDLVTQAKGSPVVIFFVHELTRPSIGLTRTVMNYAASRKKDGLTAGVFFLGDDKTELETRIKRARRALPNTPIGIATGGKEGPGSYGLNRKMTLTVLVAKDNKVTANFPLVQPSLQTDGPKILAQIVKVLGGGKVPTLAELGARGRMNNTAMQPDPRMRGLLRPVIQKTASEKEVKEAAAKVEKYVAKNKKARNDLGRIANRIVSGGVLKNYGTPTAQKFISQWAKKYAPKRPQQGEPKEKSEKKDSKEKSTTK